MLESTECTVWRVVNALEKMARILEIEKAVLPDGLIIEVSVPQACVKVWMATVATRLEAAEAKGLACGLHFALARCNKK
jgi:hypothetical protein